MGLHSELIVAGGHRGGGGGRLLGRLRRKGQQGAGVLLSVVAGRYNGVSSSLPGGLFIMAKPRRGVLFASLMLGGLSARGKAVGLGDEV